jgi:hypothetical protein
MFACFHRETTSTSHHCPIEYIGTGVEALANIEFYTYRTLSQSREHIDDPNLTPQASHEPWRFTPPLLNSNSVPFATFTNQLPVYYTPTAGGTSTLYHSQAGDLHIPGIRIGMDLGTPLLLPILEDGVHIGWMVDRHGFPPETLQPYEFHNFNPFEPNQCLAVHYLSNQPSDFEFMDASGDRSPTNDSYREPEMSYNSPIMNTSSRPYYTSMSAPLPASSKKCVYILLIIRSAVVALYRKIVIFGLTAS